MRILIKSLRAWLALTLLTGIAYPVLVTALAQGLFSRQANGSLVVRDGVVVGSELIGQKFERPTYFWPRPSSIDWNPLPSGGSNLSQASGELRKAQGERRSRLASRWAGDESSVPGELTLSSGSGLDPHLSPEAALAQAPGVARARGLAPSAVENLVRSAEEPRQLGFLGEPRVNVLRLNLALDELQKTGGAR